MNLNRQDILPLAQPLPPKHHPILFLNGVGHGPGGLGRLGRQPPSHPHSTDSSAVQVVDRAIIKDLVDRQARLSGNPIHLKGFPKIVGDLTTPKLGLQSRLGQGDFLKPEEPHPFLPVGIIKLIPPPPRPQFPT